MPSASELRELDDDELDGRLVEYRRELLNLRFQLGTGQLDNVTRLSQVRRDIARVLTVLRDREIATAEGRDAGPVVAARPPRPARTERPARARARSHSAGGDGEETGSVADDDVAAIGRDDVDDADDATQDGEES